MQAGIPGLEVAEARFRDAVQRELSNLMTRGVERSQATEILLARLRRRSDRADNNPVVSPLRFSTVELDELVQNHAYSPEDAARALTICYEMRQLETEGIAGVAAAEELTRRVLDGSHSVQNLQDFQPSAAIGGMCSNVSSTKQMHTHEGGAPPLDQAAVAPSLPVSGGLANGAPRMQTTADKHSCNHVGKGDVSCQSINHEATSRDEQQKEESAVGSHSTGGQGSLRAAFPSRSGRPAHNQDQLPNRARNDYDRSEVQTGSHARLVKNHHRSPSSTLNSWLSSTSGGETPSNFGPNLGRHRLAGRKRQHSSVPAAIGGAGRGTTYTGRGVNDTFSATISPRPGSTIADLVPAAGDSWGRSAVDDRSSLGHPAEEGSDDMDLDTSNASFLLPTSKRPRLASEGRSCWQQATECAERESQQRHTRDMRHWEEGKECDCRGSHVEETEYSQRQHAFVQMEVRQATAPPNLPLMDVTPPKRPRSPGSDSSFQSKRPRNG